MYSYNVDQQSSFLLNYIYFFHNICYMYLFRTQKPIFRKAVLISTGTVQYMCTCMVQPGSSKCSFDGIAMKDTIRYVGINCCLYCYVSI